MTKLKHVKYPKTPQFRNVVYSIKKASTFVGLDENNEPIYKSNNAQLPKIKFTSTVKLHGTNASVCYNLHNGIYTQSRNNSFTLDKTDSHYGFTDFVSERKEIFQNFFNNIIRENSFTIDNPTITIYGEWVGKNIQKGVAISNLEKSFFIFGIKISKPNNEKFESYWVSCNKFKFNNERIYNIHDYEKHTIEIDFNTPEMSLNILSDLTLKVENECPVSKEFGFSGIGEGLVWIGHYNNKRYIFKTKGEKHSNTKVKKVATVDVEKLNNIQDFVEYSVTENRFNQALENIFENNSLDIKKLGDVIRWVIKDISEEENDTLTKNNLTQKDVNKYISNKVRKMFLEKYNNF